MATQVNCQQISRIMLTQQNDNNILFKEESYKIIGAAMDLLNKFTKRL